MKDNMTQSPNQTTSDGEIKDNEIKKECKHTNDRVWDCQLNCGLVYVPVCWLHYLNERDERLLGLEK